MISISEKLDRFDASVNGIAVTVLKDGPAKCFKRHTKKVHTPNTSCPKCSATLEKVKMVASSGRYLGSQLYCGACDKQVGPFECTKTMLVAELDGVRVYIDGDTVLVTKKDLHA